VIGEERAATGLFSQILQNLVAFGEVHLAVGKLVGIGLRQLNPLGLVLIV
jgi:hypothetical protein